MLDEQQQHAVGMHVSFCVPLKLLMSGHNLCQQQQQLIAVAQQQQLWWQQQQLQVTCIVGLLAIKPPSTKVRMLASASSGVVLMKAAAGHSHVSTLINIDRLLAPLLLHSFISYVKFGRKQGDGGRGGGGGESDMVNVALLLMEFSQIELMVYRGLQRGKAGLPCLQTVVV